MYGNQVQAQLVTCNSSNSIICNTYYYLIIIAVQKNNQMKWLEKLVMSSFNPEKILLK